MTLVRVATGFLDQTSRFSYIYTDTLEGTTSRNAALNPLSRPMRLSDYQLISLLPFAMRRFIIVRPAFVLSRARNPCRRFCTRREGLYVQRLPAREAEAENGRDWIVGSNCKGACVIEGAVVDVVLGSSVERRDVVGVEVRDRRERERRSGEDVETLEGSLTDRDDKGEVGRILLTVVNALYVVSCWAKGQGIERSYLLLGTV
jgi:hypothetical protein